MSLEISQTTVAEAELRDSKTILQPASYYGAILRKKLDNEVFKPVPSQLVYLAGHFMLIGLCFYSLVWLNPHWTAKILLSICLGFSFGLLGFIAHELLHGSIIRHPLLQHILARICLLPYLGSPTFWKFWHNKLHHGNTQSLIIDPDAFPTLRIYKYSKFMKFMFPFTPGSGTLRSYAYFFFWFCFNFIVAQVYFRFRNKIYQNIDHKRVNREFATQVLAYLTFIGVAVAFGGWQNLFWVWLLPFIVQNYIIMSYVATNHNLSPLTSVNDPLVNSVTVTNHPALEFLHLNFGYHVEHHIFPTVSSKHAKKLHYAIKEEWPEKFQVVPKWTAIKDLYKTPRIYKNSNSLIHPKTMEIKSVKNYSENKVTSH